MEMVKPENLNAFWAYLVVEELVRNGIDFFCISPGSRSTPLTVAAARNEKVKTKIFYDERTAGFFALGYARATGKPATLVCTSGTAVANYLPAVIEASIDAIPMLILSADRPPELRETGANQTIRQPGLFRDHIRWQFDMPCPDEKIPPQMVLTTINQAIHRSLENPSGAVHINLMFREPLAPSPQPYDFSYLQNIQVWDKSNSPYTQNQRPILQTDSNVLREIAEIIKTSSSGLLVVGRLSSLIEAEAVQLLAKSINWPLFADITSGLRLGASFAYNLPYFDQMLLSPALQERLNFDTILHIGGQLVSKRFLQFSAKKLFRNYILVKGNPSRYDPAHAVTHFIQSDVISFCNGIERIIGQSAQNSNKFQKITLKIEQTIEHYLKDDNGLNEIWVARYISQVIPENFGLFLASSMPIRDMDMYATPDGAQIPIAANRGASGIDGTIASATGFAQGLGRPVILLIGDLAFLHDLNSLSPLANSEQPVIIVLLNNQGGGIFSFLPISGFDEVFERFFGTPHSLTFEHAAKLFQFNYFAPTISRDFMQTFIQAVNKKKSTLIEVRTNRQENIKLHQDLQSRIAGLLRHDKI